MIAQDLVKKTLSLVLNMKVKAIFMEQINGVHFVQVEVFVMEKVLQLVI